MSLNNCLTTKYLTSVITVKDCIDSLSCQEAAV